MKNELAAWLDEISTRMSRSEMLDAYADRHGIDSASILTVRDDEMADALAGYLAPRIEGRIVIEVGAGLGLLALHMGQYAKRVFCIEANPLWSWSFAALLLAHKPKNVSFLFGTADEFAGQLHADVALFCTHSDAAGMRVIAGKFAREVIDVYSEVVEAHWNAVRDLKRSEYTKP